MDTLDAINSRIIDLMRAHRHLGGFATVRGILAFRESTRALIIEGGWDPTAFYATLDARLQEHKQKTDPIVRTRIE